MWLTALTLLLAPIAQAPEVPTAASGGAPAGSTRFRGAFELSLMSFPSGTPGGSQDLFSTATPVIAVDAGEDFAFELGAELRLRVFDDPPGQRERDYGGVLRFEDWDEPSDFGQLLRELRIGAEDGAFQLRAGALRLETLGAGHLVSRYSNRTNPNYHPAGARLRFFAGPVRTEVLASDFLAARLFAADVSVDLGEVISDSEEQVGRYHAGVSLAHDHGEAGGLAPRATLLQVDVDAALYRTQTVQLFAVGGVGTRMFAGSPDVGASLGLAIETQPAGYQLGGKLEARKVGGGFRQGFFGPGYELARFAGLGLSSVPLAEELLPDGWSGFGEFSFAMGLDAAAPEATRLLFTAALEQFSFGRTDADAAVSLEALNRTLLASARFIATGINRAPRYLVGADVRYRFLPSLYAVGFLGNVYFPVAPGQLARGFYAGVGAGVDFER